MLCAKVIKTNAEKIKQYLIKHKLFDQRYKLVSDQEYIYFPVIKKFKYPTTCINIDFVQHKDNLFSEKNNNLKRTLGGKLNKQEMQYLKTSFDIVGTIAIIEIPEQLVSKEKLIGEALLSINHALKTVVKKVGIHGGEFRTQKVKIIAGKRTKETMYRENGVLLTFNIENVYFSVRLATERKRICQQIKKGEAILVMFSGCGVYPLVFAKNTAASEIIGIEKNIIAHHYALGNKQMNKVDDVAFLQGDVRKIIPQLHKKHMIFDRILMPLPKNAGVFLDLAFLVARKGAIIHFYDFIHEQEEKQFRQKIKTLVEQCNHEVRILRIIYCGQYAPHCYRVCADLVVV